MELIIENETVVGIKDRTKIVKTRANKGGKTFNYRFKLPTEIFKGLYDTWSTGLKIYFYKKDDTNEIYISNVEKDNGYAFSLLNQNKKNIIAVVNINKNMAELEPDYKNKDEIFFIGDKKGIRFFFM